MSATEGQPAIPKKGRSLLRKQRQRGSEMVEFTLVMLPMLGFLFLTLNIAWAVYSRATLQYAVAQGVRYAVTSQTITGMGQKDSIRTVVQQNAFGRLGVDNKAPAWANIEVHFYRQDGTDVSNVVGGNGVYLGKLPMVQVSVEALSQRTFLPFIGLPGMGTLGPIVMSARAWDRMEASPAVGKVTGPPAM